MGLKSMFMAGGCVVALCLVTSGVAEAKKALQCASPAEVTAMQASAVQQELMDAALTCGDEARTNYNAFQTSYGPELRRSDKTLLQLFHRVQGFKKGDAAYNLFKTNLASKAELRRVHAQQDFCTAANLVVAAALVPNRPSLKDFVDGVQIKDVESPIDSCQVEVAVTLQGVMAGPDIVPKPNPLRVAAVTQPAPLSAVPPSSQTPASPVPPPGGTAAVTAPDQTPAVVPPPAPSASSTPTSTTAGATPEQTPAVVPPPAPSTSSAPGNATAGAAPEQTPAAVPPAPTASPASSEATTGAASDQTPAATPPASPPAKEEPKEDKDSGWFSSIFN